jgi:hypothetical protein
MTTDKWRWQCRLCKASASVRKNAFFSHSHLSLRLIIIILIYCWAMDFSQNIIAHEAEIGQGINHTMVDWASFCREICEQHLMDHPMEIGGLDQNGMSLTVEIDESKFFTANTTGQWREGHTVFGGIERNSGKCFLVEVPDRTEATLLDIIERYSGATVNCAQRSKIEKSIPGTWGGGIIDPLQSTSTGSTPRIH